MKIERADRETIRILVVDDERTLREGCASILRTEGYPVTLADTGEEALRAIRRIQPEIILLDLYLPDMSGLDVLRESVKSHPEGLVVVMTGKASVESSVEALKQGAWNYIPKPFPMDHLNILVGRAAHAVMIARESEVEQDGRPEETPVGDEDVALLGESGAFRRVVEAAEQVAGTDASVFLTGESGTGKELIAQFIHRHSRRSSRQMVSVNSSAIPESLLESELFGHVRGAFTGAVDAKQGLLEAANGGTLFLDEITEMPASVQAKLLRVVQDGVIRRVGSVAVDAIVDMRYIAATNRPPGEAVHTGQLRKDLHYRLCVVPIHLPPLRDRPEDIPILARHYLKRFWSAHRPTDAPCPELSKEAVTALQQRPWPGNVRELRNLMEHTTVLLSPEAEVVEPGILPFLQHELRGGEEPGHAPPFETDETYHAARDRVLDDFERRYLKHVMRLAMGNLSDAARVAEVDRATLYRLMEKHDISKKDLLKPGST